MLSSKESELVKAQNEVIGILFEVIKRLQANIDLQDEGVNIIIETKDSELKDKKNRLDEITNERNKNSEIISQLLKKLDSDQ